MKLKLEIISFVAALAIVTILAGAWNSARQNTQQLAATLAAQKTLIQEAGDRETHRDAEIAELLAKIQTQKRSVRTPQQAAAKLAEALPELPLPVSIATPNLTRLESPEKDQDPSTSLKIPEPDLVPLYDALQDCRAGTAENLSLKKDLSDERSRSASLTTERNALMAKSHSGTWLTRLKTTAKWFTIGLLAGTTIATAIESHH